MRESDHSVDLAYLQALLDDQGECEREDLVRPRDGEDDATVRVGLAIGPVGSFVDIR